MDESLVKNITIQNKFQMDFRIFIEEMNKTSAIKLNSQFKGIPLIQIVKLIIITIVFSILLKNSKAEIFTNLEFTINQLKRLKIQFFKLKTISKNKYISNSSLVLTFFKTKNYHIKITKVEAHQSLQNLIAD